MVVQDPLEPPGHLDQEAHSVPQAPEVPLVRLDHEESLAWMEVLAHQDAKEKQVNVDNQVNQGPRVNPENPDLLVSKDREERLVREDHLELLANQEKEVYQDHLDHQDLLDLLENEDFREREEIQVVQDLTDHQDHQDLEENRECQVNQVDLDHPAHKA